jgi:hypothetical protein
MVMMGAVPVIIADVAIFMYVKVEVGGNIPNRNVLLLTPEPKFQYPLVVAVVKAEVSAHIRKYPPPLVLAELIKSKILVPPSVIALHATFPEVTELQATDVAVTP